jgi:hypothetical protein
MIDWVGEFNTYLTPFAPFGMPTVSDQLQPGLPEFLYALSKSDGADPTLWMQHGGDQARNGEPFGELGLIIRQDAAWGDQRGNPRDPQSGNIPGGARDVLRTSGNKVLNSPASAVNLTPMAPIAASAPATISSAPSTTTTMLPAVTAATTISTALPGTGKRMLATASLRAVRRAAPKHYAEHRLLWIRVAVRSGLPRA